MDMDAMASEPAAAAADGDGMSAEKAEKIQAIVKLTAVKPPDAQLLLEAHGWDVSKIQSLLQVADPDSRKRKAPTSFDPTPQASSRAKPKKKSKTKAKAAAKAKPKAKPKPKPKAADAETSEKKPSTSAASASARASSSSPMNSDGDATSRDMDEKSSAAGEVLQALTRSLVHSRQSSAPTLTARVLCS
jgi:outer membrane biosynthesis protein TonB